VLWTLISLKKIHRLGRVLNPQHLGPVASTVTTTPPRRLEHDVQNNVFQGYDKVYGDVKVKLHAMLTVEQDESSGQVVCSNSPLFDSDL
jgi:hypothetical protein